MFRNNVSISGCRELGVHIRGKFYFALIIHKCFHIPVFEILSTCGDIILPAEKFQFALHNDVLSFELYVGWLKYVYYKR